MHIISRKKLLDAAIRHGDLVEPLDAWYRTAKRAAWKRLVETRHVMPTADAVEDFVVFNIKGNTYRLITQIYFAQQVILVRHVLTHAEYDKGGWK